MLLTECDVNLFGNDRQPLGEPYGIFVGEGKFYLVLDHFESGCGLLGEAIDQIGWSDAVILVQLEPCVGSGRRRVGASSMSGHRRSRQSTSRLSGNRCSRRAGASVAQREVFVNAARG